MIPGRGAALLRSRDVLSSRENVAHTEQNTISNSPTHLFVYGTLMSTAAGDLGRDMRLRLRREARVVGAATLQGRLHDLGRYPVMVSSDDAADIVHGELLDIIDPVVTLPWLDDYEGIGRGAAHVDEYRRIETVSRLTAGGELAAWVYLFNRPVTGLPRIRSGRWQARR
jgi:gamma-glutamylcyclotransferase (GGCT)/AIG2-like uncharacterized protein YtfP